MKESLALPFEKDMSKTQRDSRSRLQDRWSKRSNRANPRRTLAFVLIATPGLVWAIPSVLAAGKWPTEVGLGHVLLGLSLIAILGTFMWDASDSSRTKSWSSSWRGLGFRLASLALSSRANAQRCPYCHDAIEESPRACGSCEATFHGECWEELGGCSSLGCEERARAPVKLVKPSPVGSKA